MRALIALSLLMSGTIGWADEPADPPKDPRICRDSAETGTRIRIRECHPKSEWVAIDAVRRQQFEQLNRSLGRGAAAEQAPSGRAFP